MSEYHGKVALVTGASSGFGEAIARKFASEGIDVALGARRSDRLDALAKDLEEKFNIRALSLKLDVQDENECRDFVKKTLKAFNHVDILINNAGLALGRDRIEESREADLKQMFDTNVLGLYRMTREIAPHMRSRQKGHIVNIGSIAGHLPYEGAGGYCASKASVRMLSQVLRMETLGSGIRVTSVDPGLAETEFSVVRFRGDREKARKVYEGLRPLHAEDVAECVWFAVSRPEHVAIDEIVVTSIDQAGVSKLHRRT